MKIKTKLQLSKEETNKIIDFVENDFSNNDYFQDNGNSRRYCSVTNKSTPITDYLKELRIDKFRQLGIEEFDEEPIYGIFIGVNSESGYVHPHKDPEIEGYYHFRLNFLVSKPESGGMPVINGNRYEVEELESWINIASQWYHMSTPVSGNKKRIVLSLGAYVKKEIIDDIYDQIQLETIDND